MQPKYLVKQVRLYIKKFLFFLFYFIFYRFYTHFSFLNNIKNKKQLASNLAVGIQT